MDPMEKTYRKGEVIIKEGYAGRTVYVIRRGMVEVLKHVTGGDIQLTVLGPNEFFGEISLLDPESPKRSATVRALEETQVRVMSREEFESYIGELSPGVRSLMLKLARRLRETNRKVEDSLTRNKNKAEKLPPFEFVLTMDELEQARENSVDITFLTRKFTAGQVVLKEGEPGYCGFIVRQGRLEVSRTADGSKVVLGELNENDIAGESALFDETRRNATVKALTDGEMLVFGKRDIINMARRSPLELFMVLDSLSVKISRLNERYCETLIERDNLAGENNKLQARLTGLQDEFDSVKKELKELRSRTTDFQRPPSPTGAN